MTGKKREVTVKARGIKDTPIVVIDYDTHGVLYLKRAPYEDDELKSLEKVDFQAHEFHQCGTSKGTINEFENLLPRINKFTDSDIHEIALMDTAGKHITHTIPVTYDLETGMALVNIDVLADIEEKLEIARNQRAEQYNANYDDMDILEQMLGGVVTCPKCGNQIEPDCQKCPCGWTNPVAI